MESPSYCATHFPEHQSSDHARHGDFPQLSGHAGPASTCCAAAATPWTPPWPRPSVTLAVVYPQMCTPRRRQLLAHLQRQNRRAARPERQRPRRGQGHHRLLRLKGTQNHSLPRLPRGQHRARRGFRLGRGLSLQSVRPQDDHALEGALRLGHRLRQRRLSGEHLPFLLERRQRRSRRQGVPRSPALPRICPRVHEGRQASRHGRHVPSARSRRHADRHCGKGRRRILQGRHRQTHRGRSGKERRHALAQGLCRSQGGLGGAHPRELPRPFRLQPAAEHPGHGVPGNSEHPEQLRREGHGRRQRRLLPTPSSKPPRKPSPTATPTFPIRPSCPFRWIAFSPKITAKSRPSAST